jgi:hypothetical protein
MGSFLLSLSSISLLLVGLAWFRESPSNRWLWFAVFCGGLVGMNVLSIWLWQPMIPKQKEGKRIRVFDTPAGSIGSEETHRT